MSTEELREMVGHLKGEQLMKRIQRHAAKILGSSQYWFKRYFELNALLERMEATTFFWTVSSADTYCQHQPQLTKIDSMVSLPIHISQTGTSQTG